MVDWRFIIAKHIVNRRWQDGYITTFDTIIDHTEDFAKEIVLQKGKLFIDAGAHGGMWSMQASPYYDRILAIEPTPRTRKSLRTNLILNNIHNVEILPFAVTSHNLGAVLYDWRASRLGNSLFINPVDYTDDYGHGEKMGYVETITIDSLKVKPDTIKLDVEGSEYDAIEGGLNTIELCRPKLFIEIHHKDNEKKIREVLPSYTWNNHQRYMAPRDTTPFYQTHMIGECK